MNILILGSGGREHALATAYAKSLRVDKVYVAPGNDFMQESSPKIRIASAVRVLDANAIVKLVKKERIDLVDVAQDDPLAFGMVDFLQKHSIKTFGPTKKAAEIEWNKAWARVFMQRYNLPIPRFASFTAKLEAIKYIRSQKSELLYIKAAGLAQGKGALRAENEKEAYNAIHAMTRFGQAGKTFLIEEGMVGEEFSLFAICDRVSYKILLAANDHKTVFTGDQGPNTGGMGCVAPTGCIDSSIIRIIEQTILKPFIHGMQKEGRSYSGILYLGGMVTRHGNLPAPYRNGTGPAGRQVKIVEFNARWGDPEAQVILPGLKTDYLRIVQAVINQTLESLAVTFDNKIRVSIAGCARGYPIDYSKVLGKKIYGVDSALHLPGVNVFGAGMKRIGKQYVVNGGRIFHLVAEGATISEARSRAYAAMSQIHIEGNNLHYRTDIGWREVER